MPNEKYVVACAEYAWESRPMSYVDAVALLQSEEALTSKVRAGTGTT